MDGVNGEAVETAFPVAIFIVSVHPEMVDFGSGQGPSKFSTGAIAALFRGLRTREYAAQGQMPFMDEH